jgi:hypothetical protein
MWMLFIIVPVSALFAWAQYYGFFAVGAAFVCGIVCGAIAEVVFTLFVRAIFAGSFGSLIWARVGTPIIATVVGATFGGGFFHDASRAAQIEKEIQYHVDAVEATKKSEKKAIEGNRDKRFANESQCASIKKKVDAQMNANYVDWLDGHCWGDGGEIYFYDGTSKQYGE